MNGVLGDYILLNEDRTLVGKIFKILMTLWKHIPGKDNRAAGAGQVFKVHISLEKSVWALYLCLKESSNLNKP